MGHLSIRPALFGCSLVQRLTDRKICSSSPPPNLYEFFMDFLDQFYAPPFSMRDGLECLFGEALMQDIFWILVTIAFFGVGIAYVHFCERVK